MKKFNLSTIVAALSMLSSPALLANSSDDYFDMDLEQLLEVTITSATGSEQTLAQAPSIATVITAKQIERSSARTLDEVLAMVPGLKVYLNPAHTQTPSYDIRGLRNNAQILTLINGVSIDSINFGTVPLGFVFPASAIKQVEVIRGPGSAVYGADAFAGVINIITKDAHYLHQHSELGARYGSNNSAEVFANYGKAFNQDLQLGLNLSYITTETDEDRQVDEDLQSTLDGIFTTSASQAPGALESRYRVFDMNLDLTYQDFQLKLWGHVGRDAGEGAGIAQALDEEGYNEEEQLLLDLRHDYAVADKVNWNNQLVYSYIYFLNYFHVFPAGVVLPIGDDGNAFTSGGGIVSFPDGYIGVPSAIENKVAYESSFEISRFEGQTIRLALGYSYTDFDSSEKKNFGPSVLNGTEGVVDGTLSDVSNTPYVYKPDVYRQLFYISAQDEWAINERWHLTAGLRYDHYSDFGDTFNPRLALVWNISPYVSTKLLYGRAFRAPSIGELYVQNNPAGLGNKNLEPETIDTTELAFNFAPTQRLNSRLNFYFYEAKDLITTQAADVGFVYQNAEKQRGAGTELELSYQALDSLLLSADYAYRWTENNITGEPVADVPKHIAHAMADWHFAQGWYLNTDMLLVADTPRAQGDAREEIDDYAILNAALRYQVHTAVDLSLGIRNITDKAYVDPSEANPVGDYPMPRRSYFAELRYLF